MSNYYSPTQFQTNSRGLNIYNAEAKFAGHYRQYVKHRVSNDFLRHSLYAVSWPNFVQRSAFFLGSVAIPIRVSHDVCTVEDQYWDKNRLASQHLVHTTNNKFYQNSVSSFGHKTWRGDDGPMDKKQRSVHLAFILYSTINFPYNQICILWISLTELITNAIFKVSCYGHFNTLLRHPTVATDISTRYFHIPQLLRIFQHVT